MLADGSIVDVWGRKDEVDWRLPGGGAPCTSTARPGRWRSFPYLAGLEGEDEEALWSYLCRQWDYENEAEKYPGRKLIKFNFFMLQSDVLPNMGFSATRKRLMQTYECVKSDSASELPFQSDNEEVPVMDEAQSAGNEESTSDQSTGGADSEGSEASSADGEERGEAQETAGVKEENEKEHENIDEAKGEL